MEGLAYQEMIGAALFTGAAVERLLRRWGWVRLPFALVAAAAASFAALLLYLLVAWVAYPGPI